MSNSDVARSAGARTDRDRVAEVLLHLTEQDGASNFVTMAKILLRIDGTEQRPLDVEFDVVQASAGVLLVSPKDCLVAGLDDTASTGISTPEFDLLIDGRWFLGCELSGLGNCATVDYTSTEGATSSDVSRRTTASFTSVHDLKISREPAGGEILEQKPRRRVSGRMLNIAAGGVRSSSGPDGLTVFSDKEGSVTIGWIAPAVIYARVSGGVSADLGTAYTKYLRSAASDVSFLHLFLDSAALTHYDLLARSAFVRVVLASRRKFASIVVLSPSGETSPAARTLVDTLGQPIELLSDAATFATKLSAVAPTARLKHDPGI